MTRALIAGAAALAGLWLILRARDMDLLARTIWGEARGEGAAGMAAVANAIMNRVGARRWFAGSIAQVVLKPFQFSSWNSGDPNRKKMLAVTDKSASFRIALQIAEAAISGGLTDQTDGATHYHDTSIDPPNWTVGATRTAMVGRLIFYKGVA